MATGMVGVLMGVHLAGLGFDPAALGGVVAAGLAGGAAAALVVTLHGDRFGRRRSLLLVALLSAFGAVLFIVASDPWPAGAAAFVGMVNGMGRDRGAALIIDQAILPSTVADAHRTRAFAVYNVLQDVGGAFGGLCAGLPALLRGAAPPGAAVTGAGLGPVGAVRAALVLYVALFIVAAILYARLSSAVEDPRAALRPVRAATLSHASRRMLVKVTSLFAFDSLAGGFLTSALLTYFFVERFGVGVEHVGPLFFGARMANALSHLGAAWLAKRIGLVNTMVFTHAPSSLLLITVAWAPSFTVAAILFLLREGLVEMDVPTRQSYVMAVVRPEERTFASGVTHLVRVGAWAVAPWFAGLFMQTWSLAVPLVVGAVMKIAYDVLLWFACRRTLPPEEMAPAGGAAAG